MPTTFEMVQKKTFSSFFQYFAQRKRIVPKIFSHFSRPRQPLIGRGVKILEKWKKALCCIVFPVSCTFLDKFESIRTIFPYYLDHKKWTSGTLPALGLRPRAGKIFPWVTFCDLDNMENFFSYFQIFLRKWKQEKQRNKIQFFNLFFKFVLQSFFQFFFHTNSYMKQIYFFIRNWI